MLQRKTILMHTTTPYKREDAKTAAVDYLNLAMPRLSWGRDIEAKAPATKLGPRYMGPRQETLFEPARFFRHLMTQLSQPP